MDKYLSGKGIDVSKIQQIERATHWYEEPSQIYSLKQSTEDESLDYIYAFNIINETKYYRILLFEWFLSLKVNGYLVIEFGDNRIMDLSLLKKEINHLHLYKNKHKIVVEDNHGKRKKLIIQKIKSTKSKKNDINEWSFGMVTNGKREDLIEQSIKSIRQLQIPSYEIIICGSYKGKIEKDINYISFTNKDSKGWITKKKNIICETAQYNNIVVFHDRISFPTEWYVGMKQWGPNYEVLSFPIYYPNENILRYNWDTMGFFSSKEKLNKLRSTSGALDPTDWDPHVFIGGPVIAMKKNIWSLAKWDEDLFWGDSEDVELSHRQHKNGIMLRFNPLSQVQSLVLSVPPMSLYYQKNKERLGRYSMNPLVSMALRSLDLVGFRRDQKIIRKVSNIINSVYKTTNWTRSK